MLTRMNHPVSTHYLACFQRVKSMTFEPIGEVPISFDKNDLLFRNNIPILAKLPNIKIPNLEKMAQAAEKENLYNKDTCMEFHEILCELLDRFHQSLRKLKGIEKLKVQKRNEGQKRKGQKRKEGTGFNQSDLVEIKEHVASVLAFGRALRAIVRGGAIKLHLTTIASFLQVKTGKSWPMAFEPHDDAEFDLLKPYSTDVYGEPLLPWKSFHDWLRLMVHHFDAIHVLDNHLTSFPPPELTLDISIKILYPSLQDDKMLPWQDLLENEKYFPQIQPDEPSADELITFLSSPILDEKGNTIEDIIMDVGQVKANLTAKLPTQTIDAKFDQHIKTLTASVSDLEDSSSTGWKDHVKDILVQVKRLSTDSTIDGRLSRLEGILNMLENLRGSFLLYKRLKPDSSLSLGTGFKGPEHCEILAAVSNYLSGPGTKPHLGLSQNLLDEFKVSCISVPCSNICQLYNTDNRTNHRSV